MKNIYKKIIVGTANFSKNYGILNNKLPKKKINSILKLLINKGINEIDTADDYNAFLEKYYFKLKKFKIYQKINLKNFKTNKKIKSKIYKYLFIKNNITIKNLYGITLRKPEILLTKIGKEIFDILNSLKSKGIIKKIGISIYTCKKLESILKNFQIDYVQIPANLVNISVYNETIKIIKNKKIEIHARSIFLQGLLLRKWNELPSKLKFLKNYWKKIDKKLKLKNIDKYQACVNFVTNLDVDKLVVGFDNEDQLKKLLNIKKTKKIIPYFNILNKKFIDPIYWSRLKK
jgi:aryl-alcohol dehydrogenase-like predicted oxidoreductase